MKKKCVALGIILLLMGMSIISTTVGVSSPHQSNKFTGEKENSLQGNVTVRFTYPENGIYWNDHKIARFPVPLILHYYFSDTITINLEINGTENIDKIDYYLNGLLQFTWTGPGAFPWESKMPLAPFSHTSLKITAYTPFGESGIDEITIYRLFR